MNLRRLLPVALGGVFLGVATLSYALGELVVAVGTVALFGLLLLALVVHMHSRMGGNYRQIRRDQASLSRQIKGIRRDDQELLEVAERMTPVITRTVARDWSVNASRIAARYEVLEQEVRALFDEIEARSAGMEERERKHMDDLVALSADLRTSIAAETDRLARELAHLDRVPTTATVRRLVDEAVSNMDALLQLRRRFAIEGAAPILGGWALTPRAMLYALDLIEESQCDLVAECGSGASTIYIAHTMRRRGHGRVVSLEHDHEYFLDTQERIARLGLEDVTDLRYAPLVDIDLHGTKYRWYDPAALDGLEDVELVLVDGPPGATGDWARYPAVPQLYERLADNAVVLVDDATRTDEKAIIARWTEEFGLRRDHSPTNDLAVLRHGDAGPQPAG